MSVLDERAQAGDNPLRALAEYAASVKVDHLPKEVRTAAHDCIIDTVGSAIGGLDYEEVPEVLRAFIGLSGHFKDEDCPASVWGTNQKTSVFQAALLNGITGHALELDDVHTGSKSHVGTIVLPACWAVAEATGAPGSRVLEGVVAGYEVMARIGMGFGVSDHRMRGWHATGTAGTFGAAAAAGRVLGLDAERMLSALGMAGTQSSGVWAFLADGATSKKLHTGRAAENGVVAAFLAKAGMTGPAHILDAADGGLYRAMSGAYDLSAVATNLGETYEITKIDRKPYSCCRSMHAALDAILSARGEKNVHPEEIERISIRSYEVGVKQCGVIFYPANASEAKFSMRFGVAVAYLDGRAGRQQFSQERIDDPAVRELASRIDYEADETYTSRYPKNWGCSLVVHYRDGTIIERRVADASGSVATPLVGENLDRKFVELASPFLKDRSALVLKALKELEHLPKVNGLLSIR